jgi:hemerythrin-like domain-containing protein
MRDILATLKREHDQLRDLHRQLSATPDEQDELRQDLLNRIEAVLIPHAKWEELKLYPAFNDRANHQQQLLFAKAMQEHRAVEKAVLPDLHAADLDSRQFAGSAAVLEELIVHHAEEEETQMFSVARKMFSPQELAEMDEQYADWKDSALAGALEFHAKAKTAAKSILRSPSAPG